MRYSIATGIVMAVLSIGDAMAGPAHSFRHKKMHEKKAIDYANMDWANMGINWKSAWAAGQAAKATPTPTPTPAGTPAASTPTPKVAAAEAVSNVKSTISSANSIIDDIADLFDGIVGHANDRTAFGDIYILPGGSSTSGAGLQGDFFNGNIGHPYAANILKVSSRDGYDYTAKFTNSQSKAITVNCWNKAGSDNQPLSGSAMAPKDTALTFTLPAGSSQIVAFQVDSQIGCAEACKEKTASGAFLTSWVELNFPSAGGAGYDVSAINCPKNNYKMVITSTEAPQCKSSNTENFWLTPDAPQGDSNGSCYIATNTATLDVEMGGFF